MTTIFLIATAKYKIFLHQAIRAIERWWDDTDIVIFTDIPSKAIFSHQYKIRHKHWPYSTLLRFHYFNMVKDDIKTDYVYYVDVDARFIDKPDVKGDLVGTLHCGYYFPEHRKSEPPEETNPKSVFYGTKFKKYYGGGFFGGTKKEFYKLSKWCQDKIDQDLDKGIIPVWHDETALNTYFAENKPTLELTPDYHFPEDKEHFIKNCWGGMDPFEPKLLLLEKDHAKFRN